MSRACSLREFLPPVTTGTRIAFAGDSGNAYLRTGWSDQEKWGRWSNGPHALLVFPLHDEKISSVTIEAQPLIAPNHPVQTVEILVNGIEAGKIAMTEKMEFDIQVPEASQQNTDGLLRLEFHLPDAVRPSDIGGSKDTRTLALGLIAATLH
ncbi:MAG: hypothetical protein LBO00_07760 [Zoogloeaceae bacterium]|nr:hypothetical protein [Zoogloeaceae bacterium]